MLHQEAHLLKAELTKCGYGQHYLTKGNSYEKSLGNMITVKTGIYSNEQSQLKLGSYRTAISVKVMGVVVVNTHLEVQSSQDRLKQAEKLTKYISTLNTDKYFLVGDMNDTIEKPCNQHFLSFGFVDSFAAANCYPPQMTCWAGTCVDYIFSSRSLAKHAIGSYVIQSINSDHMPVMADFANVRSNSNRKFQSNHGSATPIRQNFSPNFPSTVGSSTLPNKDFLFV